MQKIHFSKTFKINLGNVAIIETQNTHTSIKKSCVTSFNLVIVMSKVGPEYVVRDTDMVSRVVAACVCRILNSSRSDHRRAVRSPILRSRLQS